MLFDFNHFSSLLLPGFVQALVMGFLFLLRGFNRERLSDRLLGVLLLLFAIKLAYWMLGFAGWYDSHDGYTRFMFYFPFENMVWMGPLLYFYFISLTNADFSFQKKHWSHLVLPVTILLLTILKAWIDFQFYSPFPVLEENQYGTKGPWADITRSYPVQIAGYLSFFFYTWQTARAYRAYQSYIRANFSDIDPIRFSWIRNILIAISAGIILFFIFELLPLFNRNWSTYQVDWYAYFMLGILVYYVSISGYAVQERPLDQLHFQPLPLPVIESGSEEVKSAVFATGADPLQWEKLKNFVEKEKCYLDAELTINGLSARVKIPVQVVSRLINENSGMNFSDFINQYRVAEVKEKLKSGEHKRQTLLGIALDAGFNSKATFNRVFKKMAQCTPREWIDHELGKE